MHLRRWIAELSQIMRDEDLAEIEVRRFFSTIRIRRPGADAAVAGATAPGAPAPGHAPVPPSPAPEAALNLIPIKSPMVGTFYRSPSADADPYVEMNTRIDVGQTVCIVEAMKLMNEIEADVAGTVTAVLAEDGSVVEYGQPLFRIVPA